MIVAPLNGDGDGHDEVSREQGQEPFRRLIAFHDPGKFLAAFGGGRYGNDRARGGSGLRNEDQGARGKAGISRQGYIFNSLVRGIA